MAWQEYEIDYDTLKIHPDWNVLEIGGGSNPFPRANTILNYRQSDNQRNKKIKKIDGARMLELDVTDMSIFKDKEFDFCVCIQVLEHISNAEKAMNEMMRVSRAGYIQCPSELCEALLGWDFHFWRVRIDERNPNKLVLIKKKPIDYELCGGMFKRMFYEDNLYRQNFVDLVKKYSNLWIVKFNWNNNFIYEIIG